MDSCCLCHAPGYVMGVFTPTQSFAKRIGQPPGKQRVVVYWLCPDCTEMTDVIDLVEQAMLRELQVQ